GVGPRQLRRQAVADPQEGLADRPALGVLAAVHGAAVLAQFRLADVEVHAGDDEVADAGAGHGHARLHAALVAPAAGGAGVEEELLRGLDGLLGDLVAGLDGLVQAEQGVLRVGVVAAGPRPGRLGVPPAVVELVLDQPIDVALDAGAIDLLAGLDED